LAAAVDPSAMSSLYASGANNMATAAALLGGLKGAVGYQPVIIALPAGGNFGASAVVSADRRYVRVSATPFFSSIGDVHTFNTATGENASGEGGNISGGFGSF
jgi:hypothetical protein